MAAQWRVSLQAPTGIDDGSGQPIDGTRRRISMEYVFASREIRDLIEGWLVHARKEWKKHGKAARRLESRSRALGVVSVALSAIVGASIFAALESAYPPWGRIVAGLLSLAASMLSSLVTFHKYAERTEKHRQAGADYKAALQALERVHATLRTSAPDPDGITKIQQTFAELEKTAPVVPEDINWAVERRFEGAVPIGSVLRESDTGTESPAREDMTR
jgi:conflict system pore-forming effector with SLATT domain